MIIVDTREQLPLWDPSIHAVIKQKLDEGDYTTTDLLGKAHVERKSGNDLYGSIIQGHARFRAELQRAIDKKITLAVFVECTRADFINKRFKGGYRLKTKAGTLSKIINTIQEKYGVDFHWCDGRDELTKQVLQWFGHQRESLQVYNVEKTPVKPHKAEFTQHTLASRAVSEVEEKKKTIKWG